MRAERMGKGAAVTSESCKLAGADEGGLVSSQSPRSWTLVPQMQSRPAGLGGVWGCGEAPSML